ncbi:MAG TPA: hypothetical protein VL354_18905 [Spirochaetia bacterium]|nr:hypothetical protein [Spirochaetia bacterium]
MTPNVGWLAESKRRVFFDMHLPAWPQKGIAERFDPEALASAIADSGADSAVLFAKCQYGNFYTSIEGEMLHPGLRGVDLLTETAAGLRSRGVRTVAYYSVSWDEKIAGEHPEWLVENANGERGKGPWRWRTLCINSPYAQLVEQHLALLAAKPVDGIWLDMTIVGDGNCYCPACRERFRQEKGGELPRERTDEKYPEFLGFRYDVVEAFYARVRETIRRVAPSLMFTNNYWGYPHSSAEMGSRAVGSTRCADFVTGEAYSDWSGIRSTSFLPLFLRGVAGGRPYEGLIAGAINTWDYTRKPKAYLSFEAFSLFAHGATVTVDDEPLHDGSFDGSFYREDLKEIFGEVARHCRTVTGSPVRYAAVYHSQRAKDRSISQADFIRDVSGSLRILEDLHLPVEFVFDERLGPDVLRDVSVLLMSDIAHLGDPEWSIVSAFLERGGLVIASGGLGQASGSRHLGESLDIQCRGMSQYSLSYLRLPGVCSRDLLVRGPYARYASSASDEGCVVDPICETGTNVFFHNNLPGPHTPTSVPGLVLRRLGKGTLALFPQAIFRHYAKEPQAELRRLVHGLIQRHCPPPAVELSIPMKMGYATYGDGDTLYVHLLNPNVEPSICCGLMDTMDGRFERSYEYMEETVAVHDLGVRIPGRLCTSAEALREHSPLTVHQGEGGVDIRVGRVELWEIVKISLSDGGPS